MVVSMLLAISVPSLMLKACSNLGRLLAFNAGRVSATAPGRKSLLEFAASYRKFVPKSILDPFTNLLSKKKPSI
jgi:hypothetical protein